LNLDAANTGGRLSFLKGRISMITKTRFWKVTALCCIITALAGLRTARLNAQVSNPGNPTLLNTLQLIQSAVDAVHTVVLDVQAAIAHVAAPDQANVRTTPPFPVTTSAGAECSLTNVSTTAHTVKTELIDGQSNVTKSTTASVAAGFIGVLQVPNISGQRYYCKFTVIDGSRTDIRGTAFVMGFNVNPIVLYQVDAE
jgi:hypothetical protein